MRLPPLKAWFRHALTRPRQQGGEALAHTDALPNLADAQGAQDASAVAPHWTASRLAIESQLWGDGYLFPGGGAELARLARPLGLSSASTVLLLGTGTGGPPASLVQDFGVWVVAHEADPVLCQHSADRIARAPRAVAKRATVAGFDSLAPMFRPRYCNHAIVMDTLRDAPLEPMLAAVTSALKPHGQIVMVELVADQPLNPADPAIAPWLRLEGRGPALHSALAISRGLSRLGLDVRVEEDLTEHHIKLALTGWHDMVLRLAANRPPADQAAAVVMEAEMWTRRMRLLQSGKLRLIRWHAFAGAAAG